MIGWIVVIAFGVALAPYILSILGWGLGLALLLGLLCGALFLFVKTLDDVGDWFDRTALGLWINNRGKHAQPAPLSVAECLALEEAENWAEQHKRNVSI